MEKANPFSSERVDALGKNSENVKTLRFELSLTESDEKKCPEFSFLDLFKAATTNGAPDKPPWNDEGDDDEKLKALAKKFEEKYAPKPKKRRKDRMEDLIDVTYGYDETDPFVDDSEAYDELLPADWTTEHGGFYINQGTLSFRPASPGGDSDEEDFKKAKKVKLKSPKKIPKVPKVKKVKDPSEKKERKKSDKEKKPRKSSSGEKDKEKKSKKKHSIGNASNSNLSSSPTTAKTSATSTATSLNSSLTPTLNSQGVNGTITNHSSPAKLPNAPQVTILGALKTEPGTSTVVNGDSSVVVTENVGSAPADKGPSSSSSLLQNGIQTAEGNSVEPNTESNAEPNLPQCLPADVESCILRLKQAGSGSMEGKCKFFNSDVNHMLLELATKSVTLSSKVRTGIYEFLAFYLPCTKETLIKRAKKLLLNDLAGRLREPMAKLKAAVDRVIPEQIKRFEEEVKKHVEEESQKQSSAKQDGENSEDHKKELFKSAMELVEDTEKSDELTTPTDPNAPAQPEDKAKKNVPKRKFVWTDELRNLLCDVVQMKIKIFEMSKTRTQSSEDQLKLFFENDVQPLWPKGWMTSRILFKESKPAHSKYILVSAKVPKKASGPKKQGESPEAHQSISLPSQTSQNFGSTDVKDMSSATPSVVGIGSPSAITSPARAPSLTTTTAAISLSVLKNLAQSDQLIPNVAVPTSAITVQKPIVTTASVTKMESTAVSRSGPEQKTQSAPAMAGLNLSQKELSKSPSSSSSSGNLQSKPALTILDFADMILPGGQAVTTKPLQPPQTVPPQQQLGSFLNKIPASPKEKPQDQPLSHLPSSVVTSTISVPVQTSTISPAHTQIAMSSPPKIIRSSPAIVQSSSASQPGLMAATVGGLASQGLQNSFIDLASSLRQQQTPVSLVTSSPTILDAASQRRPDLKSCQAVHPGFNPGLSPQPITMSSNSAVPPQVLLQPQPSNLTLFNAAAVNLQSKGTTPLTHIGFVSPNLQSAMLHLSRQSQEQSGLALPQNHFNPVLLGMNPTANQTLPTLQLPHGALLSNQPVYQDPNQSSSSGTHPSPFLPRFS